MRAIIEELDDRFIVGLEAKVLTDSRLIFFKIQKAFWYFKDHFEKVIKDKQAPSMSLEMFGQLLIEESAILSKIYPHTQREMKYREWQDFLRRVPRLGAICINPTMDKVLMIQPFGRNRKCLQFPRGKLHAGEDHVRAAIREVWEECGIRLENLIDDSLFFQSTIEVTLHKLYVVFPVMEELVPTIQCNKEIEQILWYPVADLPGWKNKSGDDDRSFFGVAPFVPQIKNFIKKMKSQVAPVLPLSILKRPPPPEAMKITSGTASAGANILTRLGLGTNTSKKQYSSDEQLSDDDQEIDKANIETFGESCVGGWDFEEMMNANSKLGFKTTYNDQSFESSYGARPVVAATTATPDEPAFEDAIFRAFISGWNSG